jgi:aminoglycoside phosphotransferase (APT) family kinase protein
VQPLLDVLATTAAVARGLPRAAFGGRIRRDAGVRSARSPTREGIELALSQAFPDTCVAGIRLLDGHSGTTSRARLAVEYGSAGSQDAPPDSVFLKTVPESVAGRLFVDLMNLASTEVRFYRDIAPTLPILVPRAWQVEHDESSGAFLLILEDLARAGAHFTDVTKPVDLETARRVVETLARLHAAFWNSPRFETDLSWLRRPGPRRGLRLERCLCRALAGRGVARFADAIPPEIRAATPRLIRARDRLERSWSEGPLTFLHGDSHVGNMYFVGDAAGLFDWQVAQCGQGMRDVSYFLVTSLASELRRAHERELIELWRAVLKGEGVKPPTTEAVWRQHRLHAIYAWIGSAVTAAAGELQPEPIARAGLARAGVALAELDSLGALEEIGA